MPKAKRKSVSEAKGKISNAKDLILILLYAKGPNGRICDPIRGRTRLMKMVFLFDKEVRRQFNLGKIVAEDAMPKFKAYDYGPFSAQVYDDLEFLTDIGFVEMRELSSATPDPVEIQEFAHWQDETGDDCDDVDVDWFESQFSLSPIGKSFVEDDEAGRLNEKQWSVIESFKKRCTEADLYSLLRYVYTTYPDMAANSRIREKFLYDDDADIRLNISSSTIAMSGSE